MSKVAHLIGNGDNASMYKPAKGIKITCNLPPFTVRNTYATTIVDFKIYKLASYEFKIGDKKRRIINESN